MVPYLRSVEGGCQASKLDGGRLGQGPTWTIWIKDKCCKIAQCLAGLASHDFVTALRYNCVCNEHFRSHLGAKSGLRRYAQISRQAIRNPNSLLSWHSLESEIELFVFSGAHAGVLNFVIDPLVPNLQCRGEGGRDRNLPDSVCLGHNEKIDFSCTRPPNKFFEFLHKIV